MPVRLERVTPALAGVYRAVRLRALKDTPSAFGSTYARESRFTEAEWLARASASDGIHSVIFLAFESDAPCGLIRCSLEPEDPATAHITSMWVAPEARRSRVGTMLLDAVGAWATLRSALRLTLFVVSNNLSAIRFYQSNGFTPTGSTQPFPNASEILENEMAKPLSPPV